MLWIQEKEIKLVRSSQSKIIQSLEGKECWQVTELFYWVWLKECCRIMCIMLNLLYPGSTSNKHYSVIVCFNELWCPMRYRFPYCSRDPWGLTWTRSLSILTRRCGWLWSSATSRNVFNNCLLSCYTLFKERLSLSGVWESWQIFGCQFDMFM